MEHTFKTEDGEFYKLTEDGVKQIIVTPIAEINLDAINPSHYKSQCSLECIDAMLMAFGEENVYWFCVCSAWKYMWRYQNKSGIEDIKKARWFLNKAKELIPEYSKHQNIEVVLEKIEEEIGD